MTPNRMPGRAVIAGSLAQRPHYGGHTWVLLQYLLGFQDLGWDVLFLDRLEPGMAVDRYGRRCPVRDSVNWSYLERVMRGFGLQDNFALCDGFGQWLGLTREEVLRRVRESQLLVNVMGYLQDPELLDVAPVRVFLDIDPGFGQMWKALELADIFGGHDAFVTVGSNVGTPGCGIPDAGIEWQPILPPVVLAHWPVATGHHGGFTSIASWRGPFAPVDYRGRCFGLRVHQFRRFVALPDRSRRRFRVALDIDDADSGDRELLHRHGWEIEDPVEAAGDPWRYRRYVKSSHAEFLVAKGMYVDTGSGWVSDRSACFLASGKPVLAQETGFTGFPTGSGLVTFRGMEEAQEGVERICADYPAHALRARELAEEWFSSRKVLGGLIDRLGVA